jgi:acetylornithine/succinyldiaminopimelate/putrescine aminotransferase
MSTLMHDPVLGHITTFGGHPVCCAAGLASMKVLLEDNAIEGVERRSALFAQHLSHPRIREVRRSGLLISVVFESFEENKKIIDACIERGVFTDWFLFAPHCMRIAPSLLISEEAIVRSCDVIRGCCDLL